ncbi:MAG: hypothetical protein IKV12_04060 [Alistipes sp.]|nr:hypothetical protein [Alistipes sp.]
MKIKLFISMFVAAVIMLAAGDAYGQVATNAERKAVQKHEKVLNKAMKKKAIKAARKEAKKLAKEGWMAPVGQLPMDKQLEDSWQATYEMDSEGHPYYIMSTQRGLATSLSAAQMMAMNAAKTDIAGQIETRINQVIESKVVNNELSRKEAETLSTFVSTSKNIISTTLGRVLKFMEVYREPKRSKSIEVMVTLGYNSNVAAQEALKAMRKSLTKEDVEIMAQIDKLVTE